MEFRAFSHDMRSIKGRWPASEGILEHWNTLENSIRCSTNHFFCHPRVAIGSAKQGDFRTPVLQKTSNSRLMG